MSYLNTSNILVCIHTSSLLLAFSLCCGFFFFLLSLIDCFLVDSAAVSLAMSPTGDFLASTHVDDLGIYLW